MTPSKSTSSTETERVRGASHSSVEWQFGVGLAIVLAVVVVAVLLLINGSSQIRVPNVTSLQQSAATSDLEAAHLGVRVVNLNHSPASAPPLGTVMLQLPAAGTEVPRGTVVQINVYGGIFTVPNVTGMSVADAESALNEANFNYRIIPSTAITGVSGVIGQSPGAGSTAPAGTVVSLFTN